MKAKSFDNRKGKEVTGKHQTLQKYIEVDKITFLIGMLYGMIFY